ncbi:MAG: sulfotransferase [Bacteroidales bacterium]
MHTGIGSAIGEKQIFFIVGRPRTGTTLLRSILNAHPAVIVPPECQFIINLSKKYAGICNWPEALLNKFISELYNQWKFDTWPLDHQLLQQNLLSLKGQTTYATICKTIIQTYGSKKDLARVTHLGDKNPGYSMYLENIIKIFPDAKMIFMLRDPRDNYVSLLESGFELAIPSYASYKWRHYFTQALRFYKKYPDRIFFLKYESLIQSPHEELEKVSAFLGIEFMPSLIYTYDSINNLKADYPGGALEKFHCRLAGGIHDHRLEIWKTHLQTQTIHLLEISAGKYAEKAGYSHEFKKHPRKYKLMAFPGRLLAQDIFFLTKIINRLPAGLRMAILSKLPRKIALCVYFIFNKDKYYRFRRLPSSMKYQNRA